jgi:hypothetical protein
MHPLSTSTLTKVFVGLTSTAAIAQAVPDPNTLTSGLEHVTLVGALVTGVIVLWKSNQSKDRTILDLHEKVATALAAAADSSKELRAVVTSLYEKLLEKKA